MLREEVDLVFPLIDLAETLQIDRKALTEWVVSPYSFYWMIDLLSKYCT